MRAKFKDPDLLSKLDLFVGLPARELEIIMAEAQELSFDEGSYVFYQDDPAERIFVLKSGRVKLYQVSDDGQQILMRMLTPGMMFAAISLVEGAVYPVSAEAAEPVEVIYWSQEAMLGMIRQFPVLAINAVKILAGHVREFQNRFREQATERVERRLARTVLRLANQAGRKIEQGVLIDIPLTRQDLAEMSGTTLFTVSRILSQWEDRGLVLGSRERLVVCFPHGLVSIAEDLPVRPGNPDG
ncbi:MAG TPA: Crp/Fnr family transcriptional regulator [Levilinea sp.]|nr:Crp/Fnr family transcriptional regulator [Levilinea sp.]